MNWFRKRQPEVDGVRDELARLQGQLVTLQSAMRALQGEQDEMHNRVRRWMRAAQMAERNQERASEGAAPSDPEPPSPPRPTPWGARARMAARGAAGGNGDGVHT